MGCVLPNPLFGFLHAWEITVSSTCIIDPSVNLSVNVLQADSLVNPFRKSRLRVPGESIWAVTFYVKVCGPCPGPLFLHKDDWPLIWKQLSTTVTPVQSILHSASFSGWYSGHSFCIGAVTTGAPQSIADHLKTLRQWSSDTYQYYLHQNTSPLQHQCS